MSDTPEEEGKKEPEEGKVIAWLTNTFDPWLESRKASNTLVIVSCILISLPFIGIGLATTRTILPLDRLQRIPAKVVSTVTAPFSSSAQQTFFCANGKSIDANFSPLAVSLALSDGRTLTLPQVLSTDGARYSNTDGSFVFLTKSGTAFIAERGIQTYKNCTNS